jgi:hypothetical protein
MGERKGESSMTMMQRVQLADQKREESAKILPHLLILSLTPALVVCLIPIRSSISYSRYCYSSN